MANEQKLPVVIAQNATSTSYANVFNVQYLDGGIVLACGISQIEGRRDQEGREQSVLGVYLEDRIMMTIDSAARLAQTLNQAVENARAAQAANQPDPTGETENK